MKKFLSIFLTFLALLPATTFAQVDDWDGGAEIWTHGSGTEADPYLIETAENLAWIAEMVNSGVTTYEGVYFRMTTDLDMQSIAWVPIGNSPTKLFCGIFDGDNHFIDNISITGSYNYNGLFGITGAGFSCANLGVKTTISSTGHYGGGIVGYVKGDNTVVENCYNTGGNSTTTYNYCYFGGIVGFCDGASARISNCYNTGSISSLSPSNSSSSQTAFFYSGGIVGYCGGERLRIENCYNTGITSSSTSYPSSNSYSGGIVGYCGGASPRIENCYNTGRISSSSTSSYACPSGSTCNIFSTSYSYSGGIVGYCEDPRIENCYNTGRISSSSSSNSYYNNGSLIVSYYQSYSYSYSGGIVGSSSSTILTKCYNKGSVSATATTPSSNGERYAYAGGLVGYNYNDGPVTITYSYNRGNIDANARYGTTESGTRQVGGIIGKVDNSLSTFSNSYNTGTLTGGTRGGIRGSGSGTTTNCYYLETCGGTMGGGTSKSEASMKSTSFPILLNDGGHVFIMDVTPNINDGYPIFGESVCEVITDSVTNINFTSATLNGHYEFQQYWPGGDADVVGFEYKPTTVENYTTVYTNIGSPASYNLTGLQSGTTYNYRFFVQKDGVTYYGDVVNFSTLQCDIVAEIQTTSNSICAGDTAILTVNATSSLSDEFTYQWGNNATSAIIRTTEAGSYTVTVTDGNGCTATASSNITVNPLPNGTISGNTSLCAGESSVLTASGANSYTWNMGASTPTLTVNESGTYTCTFRNSYGCTSTQSVEVTVFSSPVITGETAFCAGGSTTLTATGGSSYVWSNGATTPSITVSTPSTYSVTGTSTGGCSGSSSVTVVQRELPSVSIYGTPVICSGIGAELTATEGSSYQWSTGETTKSITANHTGNYSVLVTDANGCSNTTSVEVGSLTSVAISGNTSICQGETATLSVEMEGEYLWSTGAQTSLISVSNAGIYSVTVSLPNGCSTSATANVSVNALPIPTISGSTTVCQGETTTLTANGGVSYHWSNNATAAAITVGTAGLYSVTVTDAMGCTGSTYTTVAVNPLPNVTISGNTATCQGTTTTLTANGAQSYQWNTGSTNATISVGAAGNFSVTGYSAQGCASTASTSVTIYPTYNTPISHSMCQGETYNFFGQNLTTGGTYTHTLYSTHGCDSVITLTLTVREVPVVSINGTTAFCEGQSTMLYANGGTSYQWNSGTSGSTLMVNAEGNYTVTATNAQGCTATASTYVTVYPLPNITISGNTATCQGNQVILTANGAQSYQWNTGSTNATIMVGATGNFTVIGYSAQGCSNTASTSVSVYPTYNTPISQSICEGETYNFFGQNLTTAGTYTYPLYSVHGCDSIITLTLTVREVPVVSISGNTSFCQGENSTLVANGGVSYNWSTGSTGSNLYVSESGAYTVTATNAQGCSATATTYVTVNELPTVTISGNTAICEGNTTTLTANGAATYQWSNGTNGANNTVDVFGNYTVTGTSAAGCSNTATTTVIVYSLPVINISGDTEICQGSNTTLTANGAETYLWNNGTTDATLTTSNAGTYTVIGTDEHGCYSTENVDVVVYYPADEDVYVSESGSYEWHDSTYTESGDYTWTGQTIHGCDSVVTLHLTITPTDTTGIATYDGSDLTLYPNPTTGIVTIRLTPETCNLTPEIQVYDVYGRMLSVVGTRCTTSLQTVQIDLSQYATGIYLVKLVNDGKVVATGKVVKQ